MPEFAPLVRSLALSSPLADLPGALKKVAHGLDARLREDAGRWRMVGGDWLATGPNDVRWSLQIRPVGDVVELSMDRPRVPWTRQRTERLLAHRLGQAAEGLEAVIAGREPALNPRPFHCASDPAGHCLLFAVHVVTMAAVMTAMMITVTLASWFVIGANVDQLRLRAEASVAARVPVLPPLHEIKAFTRADQLSASALLAMPAAFFFGIILTLGSVLGELWWRASRLPLCAVLFVGIAAVLAFGTALNPLLGISVGALVPLSGWAAAGLVWGRRSERTTPTEAKGTPRKLAGALLVLALVGALVPWPRDGSEFTDQLALFRDRYLLTNRLGSTFAHLYYRVTLYAAEPVKPAYDSMPAEESYVKLAPLALVVSGGEPVPRIMKELGFLPVRGDGPMAGSAAYDIVVAEAPLGAAGSRLVIAPKSTDLTSWKAAVAGASSRSFRGGWLLEVVKTGWKSIYYLGALFGVALLMAPLAVFAALLYRRAPPRNATLTIGVVFVLAVAALAFLYVDRGAELKELGALRRASQLELGAALSSTFPSVRHEAAYRLYRLKDPDVKPLLGGASDPDPRVRLWVCGALGRTGSPSALGSLAVLMDDPELLVRYRAAEGLGLLYAGKGRKADPGAIRMLEFMMRERSWYEAMYAYTALHRIDPERW